MSVDSLVLTVLAVLCGLLAGFARNGRLANMVGIELRGRSLLAVGVIVPLMADEFGREVAVPLVVASLGALLTFALLNTRIVGMSILAIGISCNLIPTMANDGLPVRADALVDAGLVQRSELDDISVVGARRIEEPDHRFRFLGDIIPLASTRQVLSFGDLIILVGLADVIANATLRRRVRRDGDASGLDEADDHDLSWLFGDHSLPLVQLLSGPRRPEFASDYQNPRPTPRVHHAPRLDLHRLVVDLAPDDEPLVTILAPTPIASGSREPLRQERKTRERTPAEALNEREPASSPTSPDEEQPVYVSEQIDVAEQIEVAEPTDHTEPAWIEPAKAEPVAMHAFLAEPLVIADSDEDDHDSAIDQEIDDFLSELFNDLGTSTRNRRRGKRRIPDFEPVHVDGDLTLTSR